MIINANTKIAKILKQNEAALDAIISITPKFEKLRNPLLRKLMAGRTSIAMASKISGCSVMDFYEKLAPLGFEAAEETTEIPAAEKPDVPAFMRFLQAAQISVLDVRPIIDAGKDPLALINKSAREIKPGAALKIINTFEPTPLLSLMKNQGFEYWVDDQNPDMIETYFFRPENGPVEPAHEENISDADWETCLKKFEGSLEILDVRSLAMPGPMHAILEAIETLEPTKALFVHHKKIPVFLLPHLREKSFDFRVKEINDANVHLLIFKE